MSDGKPSHHCRATRRLTSPFRGSAPRKSRQGGVRRQLRAYANVPEARASISRYLAFYNGRRPQSSLGGQAPDQAYLTTQQPIPAAA
ncbi:transposase [Thalassospira profundimaris WP0211]|nr:transposase [Thalassospira profundimaris WP0211]